MISMGLQLFTSDKKWMLPVSKLQLRTGTESLVYSMDEAVTGSKFKKK